MIIKSKIDAYKLALALYNKGKPVSRTANASRHSLLDVLCLLIVNSHPQCSKADINEIIAGERTKKSSSTDDPLNRLVENGWINKVHISGVSTKCGEGRNQYSITDSGGKLLKGED